ncbi:MAG: AAA family ATPase [Deltaproteobacteria bacterium]|nr:AAA family ATPase [Deltaproteobacteria bacterium]
MKVDRISTGIAGLDEILFGGMCRGSTGLLVGDPGTGKTIFSIQWLQQGIQEKERCLFLALLEPSAVVRRHVAGFRWSIEDMTFVDLSGVGAPVERDGGEYRVFSPSEVEQTPLWESIYRAVEQHRPQRLVIDPLTQLRHLSTDEYQFRKRLQAFHPGAGVLFASGYPRDELAPKGVLEPGTHFLQKPFSIVSLARKVREAIDARPANA